MIIVKIPSENQKRALIHSFCTTPIRPSMVQCNEKTFDSKLIADAGERVRVVVYGGGVEASLNSVRLRSIDKSVTKFSESVFPTTNEKRCTFLFNKDNHQIQIWMRIHQGELS